MNKECEESLKDDSSVETTAEAPGMQPEPAATEAPGAPQVTAEELGTLLQKLDEATAEVTAHKERYLRTVADLENYRRRALREKEEARRQAVCSLLEDLLPVLDNFKLGLQSAEQHEGGAVFTEGFRMILSQMETALRQNGLEEIHPDGGLFDPNFHESVAHLPHADIPEGHIVEVHRTGYKLQERLLRPAAVVVSSGPPPVESGQADE